MSELLDTPADSPARSLAELRLRIQRLHRERGEPSLRALSKQVLKAVSHTTVRAVLRCQTLPRWEHLQAVVSALNGDVDEFRLLWVAVRDAENPVAMPAEEIAIPRKLMENQDRSASSNGAPSSRPASSEAIKTSAGARSAPPPEDGARRSLWASAGEPLVGHEDAVVNLAFSPDGSSLASAGADGAVLLWNLTAEESTAKRIAQHAGPVWGIAFSPDGKVLASASSDSTLRLWELSTGNPIADAGESDAQPVVHLEGIWAVAFSPDGKLFATASDDRTAMVWNAQTGGTACVKFSGHTEGVLCLAFSPNGAILATGGDDSSVRLWDIETGRAASKPLSGREETRWSVAFSPEGRTLASRLEETDKEDCPTTTGHKDAVVSIAFSSDGQLLATAGLDGAIWVWRPAVLWHPPTGELVGFPILGHTDAVVDLAFSPDDRILASGSADGTVRLSDPLTGELLFPPLAGHSDAVVGVTFSGDGEILASCSEDATIRLWDPTTGRTLCEPLRGHTGPVGKVVFGPDGSILASCSDDGSVRLWQSRDAVTRIAELEREVEELSGKYLQALEEIERLKAQLRR
ncbi:hypothetical protein [Micromonospora sp. NPDC007230]|uniref:hypothetical protein n=1 Tax=Micromonospora sp. NPDC007230 TaxID=3364237 RepID=UPI0036A68749